MWAKEQLFFLREKLLQEEIVMTPIRTKQVADIFTMGLNATKFLQFRKQLGMAKREVVAKGGVLKVDNRIHLNNLKSSQTLARGLNIQEK